MRKPILCALGRSRAFVQVSLLFPPLPPLIESMLSVRESIFDRTSTCTDDKLFSRRIATSWIIPSNDCRSRADFRDDLIVSLKEDWRTDERDEGDGWDRSAVTRECWWESIISAICIAWWWSYFSTLVRCNQFQKWLNRIKNIL